MKVDSLAPPGLRGELRGWGSVGGADELSEEGGGERMKPPGCGGVEDIVK